MQRVRPREHCGGGGRRSRVLTRPGAAPATPRGTRTTRTYDAVSVALACALWGSWAFYANRRAGTAVATTAAATQAIASATITLVMVRAITALHARLPARARLLGPTAIVVGTITATMVVVHGIVGTAEIVHTILPPLTVSTLFGLYTTWTLHRRANGQAAARRSGARPQDQP